MTCRIHKNPTEGCCAEPKTARPMAEHIADIYKPPSNVTIAEVGQYPAPPRLTSSNKLIADDLRGEARAIRQWGVALRRAELAADWAAVAKVREDIATAALKLDEYAENLDRRLDK